MHTYIYIYIYIYIKGQLFLKKKLKKGIDPTWYEEEYQVVQSCMWKEYNKNIQFMATSPYYNPTTYTSCESLKNI